MPSDQRNERDDEHRKDLLRRHVALVELDRRHVQKTAPIRLVAQHILERGEGVLAAKEDIHAAPDGGRYWRFDMRPLFVTSFNATPMTPHAGSRYALRMSAVRTATGKAARGKVACSFKVDGLSLHPRTSGFRVGSAVCAFVIPLDGKGKRYRSSIALLVANERVVRAATGTVR